MTACGGGPSRPGQLADAVAAYTEYCDLLRRKLGISPSALIEQLIAECGIRPPMS